MSENQKIAGAGEAAPSKPVFAMTKAELRAAVKTDIEPAKKVEILRALGNAYLKKLKKQKKKGNIAGVIETEAKIVKINETITHYGEQGGQS
jgi:hypothetical protein